MQKIKVNHNSASVLVANHNLDKFLLAQYDASYPVEVFREHFNFIGGNARGDDSPYNTLSREIEEEIIWKEDSETLAEIIGTDSDKPEEKVLKTRDGVDRIERVKLLSEILSEVGNRRDYLVNIQGENIKRPSDLIYVSSVFTARINDSTFDRIEDGLKKGKRLVNEGKVIIAPLGHLEQGIIKGAWGYDRILRDIMGCESVPRNDFVVVSRLEYTSDCKTYSNFKEFFDYIRDPETIPPPKK